ncbi:MAG: HlyC/CorC family transporter [Planctomycetes bacterium]|nr:HlyC/CorC family transporter [Planctomycetota bacterium]
MEDPGPRWCPEEPLPCLGPVLLLAGLGVLPMTVLAAAAALLGVVLAMAQGGLENLSWRRLQERLRSEAREVQIHVWLDRVGYDRLVLTLEWLRVASYLVLVLLLDRLVLASLGEHWILGFVVLLACVLLLGESIPRFVARYNAERTMLLLLPLLRALPVVLLPLTRSMAWLPDTVARLSGKHPVTFQQERLTAEITEAAEEGERSGVLEEDEREMIENIIDLGDTEAVEVMTPRIDVVSIDAGAPREAARRLAVESGHSRIPVHEGDRDQIVGILHVKDLLKDGEENTPKSARELMRKAHFVPETKNIGELLREFKDLKTHMAIVLDEYGGTSGLITLEDILEEIVGEITDEFDTGQSVAVIRRVDGSTFRVDAKIHIHELNEAMHLALPEDAGYETLGGFVFSTLGRVPEEGETFQHGHAEFKILKADSRRVSRVQIRLPAAAASP